VDSVELLEWCPGKSAAEGEPGSSVLSTGRPWIRSCSTAMPRTGGTSVIPRNVTVTKKRRHFPFPGDLPGRILVLYHLSGTFAEEAARTVHVSQHREATERVVRIRSPHTDARVQ